ncbi:MAG: hypothetical protein N2380_06725 [bacterium]|nr:hypothetical protein [bacterium]
MKKIIIFVLLLSTIGLVEVSSGNLLAEYIASMEPKIDYFAMVKITVGNSSDKMEVLKIGEYISLGIKGRISKIYIVKKGDTYSIVTEEPVNVGALLWAYRFSKDTSLINKNYYVIFEGYENVNNVRTIKISFNPKYKSGIKRTVWVGMFPKILMKLEDRDQRGNLIRAREIESLQINPNSGKKKTIEILFEKGIKVPAREKLLSPQEVGKQLGIDLVLPTVLPVGYEFIGADIPQDETAQLIFSDGIGFMSIYQIKIPWWARQNFPPEKKGYVEWENLGIHFIVIGDLPQDMLLEVANSMKK